VLLDDRLDHERGLREPLAVAGDVDRVGVEPVARGGRAALGAGAQRHRPVTGREGGEAASDRSAPDDAEPLGERVLDVG
jgi:hypothetical protein